MMKLIFFLLHLIYTCSVDAVFGDSDVLEYSIFPSLPVAVSKSMNLRCKEESDMYKDNLKNFTLWAHEMWDSTAKSSAGVLRGNVFQMGHFEQCLSARAPFTAKYCLATITARIPEPKKKRDHLSLYFDPYESVVQRIHVNSDVSQQPRNSIKVGWCIPSSCTIHDLKNNLNDYLASVENRFKTKNITYTVNFSDMLCHTANENHYFDKADISFWEICSW